GRQSASSAPGGQKSCNSRSRSRDSTKSRRVSSSGTVIAAPRTGSSVMVSLSGSMVHQQSGEQGTEFRHAMHHMVGPGGAQRLRLRRAVVGGADEPHGEAAGLRRAADAMDVVV